MAICSGNHDPAPGDLTDSTRAVRHAAVQGVTGICHDETVAAYPNGGRDVRRVIDLPGVKAHTQKELDRMAAERNKPTTEARLIALKEENRQLLSGAAEEADTHA